MSATFFVVVCWGTVIKVRHTNRLNEMIRKTGSVVGSQLATFDEVVEQRMLTKLLAIMDNTSNPLHKPEHSEEQYQVQIDPAVLL